MSLESLFSSTFPAYFSPFVHQNISDGAKIGITSAFLLTVCTSRKLMVIWTRAEICGIVDYRWMGVVSSDIVSFLCMTYFVVLLCVDVLRFLHVVVLCHYVSWFSMLLSHKTLGFRVLKFRVTRSSVLVTVSRPALKPGSVSNLSAHVSTAL